MTVVMTSTSPDARFDYRGTDGSTIVAYRWDTAKTPRAAVQLTHGMGEHMLRYGEFARALNAEGIVVYGQDQRNHGATAKSTADLGHMGSGGWSMLVNDIHLLVERTRSENPHIPLVLLGHSMGSFAVQQYLIEHSVEVDAVILTGTSVLDLLEPAFDLDKPIQLSSFNVAVTVRCHRYTCTCTYSISDILSHLYLSIFSLFFVLSLSIYIYTCFSIFCSECVLHIVNKDRVFEPTHTHIYTLSLINANPNQDFDKKI
jgi:pimeloyl-ACP methyl ester carboxylesterase